MSTTTSKKTILTACEMSFNGKTDAEIVAFFRTYPSAISKWRKTDVWQEFEHELVEAHKKVLLEASGLIPTLDRNAEVNTPAHG